MENSPQFRNVSDVSAIPPPVTYNYTSLPWDYVPWDHFEELCYRLLCYQHGIDNCTTYGIRGQKQHGIDHLVRIPGTNLYIVYQAKRKAEFKNKDLLKAIKIWEEGQWYPKTREFVIISTNHLRDTGFIEIYRCPPLRS